MEVHPNLYSIKADLLRHTEGATGKHHWFGIATWRSQEHTLQDRGFHICERKKIIGSNKTNSNILTLNLSLWVAFNTIRAGSYARQMVSLATSRAAILIHQLKSIQICVSQNVPWWLQYIALHHLCFNYVFPIHRNIVYIDKGCRIIAQSSPNWGQKGSLN